MPSPLQLVPEALAAFAGITLALLVWRVSHPRVKWPLSAILLFDGLGQLAWTLNDVYAARPEVADVFVAIGIVLFTASVMPYLHLLRSLGTPLVAPLRRRGLPTALGVSASALGFVPAAYLLTHLGTFTIGGTPPAGLIAEFGVTAGLVAIVLVFALVASFSAFRRAAPGSAARAKARSYAVAFGTRDVLYVIAIVLNIGVVGALGRNDLTAFVYPIWAIAALAFILLLTYGILRTQLFDIDLRVRWGIQKGTVVGVIVAVAFVGEKLAEQILSREFGWVIGSILAGLLVFAAPRLNKLGDKVATTAMPKVEATPAYVHFKKLEVYKAAVESAVENDGMIDERERAMLDRLRAKLGVNDEDARAIELEAAPARGASPAPTDAAPS